MSALEKTDLSKALVSLHAGQDGALPIAGTALKRFEEIGLPSPRAENWKYTNFERALRGRDFSVAGNSPLPDRLPTLLAEPNGRFAFVNGGLHEVAAAQNLPEGGYLGSLTKAPAKLAEHFKSLLGSLNDEAEQDGGLASLNGAFARDLLCLYLPKNSKLPGTIELTSLGGLDQADALFHPRILVHLEQGAEASLAELHEGLGRRSYFSNSVSEIFLSEGANLTHLRVQNDALEALHTANLKVDIARDATYRSYSLILGAALHRQDIEVDLKGEGAEVFLDGGYLLKGRQHADTRSVITHSSGHTNSHETYKGALSDQARKAFQGKIIVAEGAAKSDGRMLNKTLLLSEEAEIDSKPELEIYNDDVQCAHGATAGAVDEDALFYLRARGLDETRAKALLIEAFLAETIEDFPMADATAPLLERTRAWLDRVEG